MADLKAIADELGLDRPQTYLASGNLVFSSDLKAPELKHMLQERLNVHLGRRVSLVIRTSEEMDRVVRSNPFSDCEGQKVLAIFLDEPPPPDFLESARNIEDERIASGQREVFVAYGERGIGHSRLRIPITEAGTARNMNTVAKLAEMAREFS